MSELADLYARMDRTRDLVYLTPFQLKTAQGQKLDDAISVTMNDPAVFANAIISDLMRAVKQVVIEGDISDKESHLLESFVEDALAQADENLLKRSGVSGLWSWLCSHVCVRSIIGARWITAFKDGEYRIDCLPVDMRYCPFVFGKSGLQWAANISYRDASSIKAEYPEAAVAGTDIEVRDYWDAEKNEVWINGKLVQEQKNPYGEPPFAIVLPPSGFMLRDKGYLEHEAEDLFFLNRGLYNELNRSVSIEQTLGMDILKPAMEQESSDGLLDSDNAPQSGQVLKVKKGELHVPVPHGDLNQASLTARLDIQKRIQMGGVNDIDLGNVSQTVSAIWITEQSEIRNKVIEPRLRALAEFSQISARMLIEQARRTAGGAESPFNNGLFHAGKTGKRKSYAVPQFPGPGSYSITYRYLTRSKKQEIANLAMAESAKGLLPLRVILKDILLAEDPDGIMRELEVEQARQADPAIALFEMALRYAEEAEEMSDEVEADAKKLQSMMLTERGRLVIRERRGKNTTNTTNTTKPPQADYQ
jgi:hypothetical protein